MCVCAGGGGEGAREEGAGRETHAQTQKVTLSVQITVKVIIIKVFTTARDSVRHVNLAPLRTEGKLVPLAGWLLPTEATGRVSRESLWIDGGGPSVQSSNKARRFTSITQAFRPLHSLLVMPIITGKEYDPTLLTAKSLSKEERSQGTFHSLCCWMEVKSKIAF